MSLDTLCSLNYFAQEQNQQTILFILKSAYHIISLIRSIKQKMGKTFSNIYESFSLNPKHNKYLIKGSALSGTLFVVYVMYLLQLLFSQNLLLWYFFSSFSFFISFSEIVSFLILSSDFNIFRHPEDFRYDPKNEELYNFSINLS